MPAAALIRDAATPKVACRAARGDNTVRRRQLEATQKAYEGNAFTTGRR